MRLGQKLEMQKNLYMRRVENSWFSYPRIFRETGTHSGSP